METQQKRPSASASGVLSHPPLGTSRLASELYALPTKVRATLRITDHVIVFIDALVTAIDGLTDDAGPVDIKARANAVFEAPALTTYLELLPDEEEFAHMAQGLEAEVARLLKTLGGQDPRAFASRLLGAATIHRLEAALKTDLATVLVGVRRLVRWAMPLALALEDVCGLLDAVSISDVLGLPSVEGGLLTLIIDTDVQIEKALGWSAPSELIHARPDERKPLAAETINSLINEVRKMITGQTTEILQDLRDTFRRKMQGAKDALAFSSDAVSQASNSLIEFIDRLLRDAFPETYVLTWINQNIDDKDELVYTTSTGVTRPTKRGQALCLAYGGAPVTERKALSEVAALSLARARRQLQELKHADDGTPEERAQVTTALSAVEGFLMVIVRVCWMTVPREHLDEMLTRFRAPGAEVVAADRSGAA